MLPKESAKVITILERYCRAAETVGVVEAAGVAESVDALDGRSVKLKKVKLCYNQRVTRNRNIAYVIVLFLILVMWKAFSYTRVIHTPKMKGIHKNVTRGINSSYRKSNH